MKAGYSNGSKRIRTIDWKNFHYYQTGQVADYIPALAEVDPKQLGMAIYDLDTKQLIEGGDADVRFAIESMSKVPVLLLAIKDNGIEKSFKQSTRNQPVLPSILS